ncbi:hypothetical protein FRX31_019654 [Thalictrum thalictroides]|uniref:Uncharacterized protein n=1 Tax=Thalictrum thalictroides TaxID=46969 RepID=A0A7J6W047_THATH|nr:hypothetical protein FRX31_019654 [Thalictrum thalictroides]
MRVLSFNANLSPLNMAIKLTVTVIFAFFVLSHARIPLTQPSNLVAEFKPSTTASEFEDTNNKEFLQTIRLPSERTEEPDTIAVSVTDLPETDTNTITDIGIARPLTITYDVSFRPINPHVHHLHMKQHPFSYRFPHRCHHHGIKTIGGPREISYGNDMIMSQNGRSDRVGRRQFKPMKGYKVNGEWLTKENFWKLRERHVDGSDQMVKEREESGLLKKFRKFLNHF